MLRIAAALMLFLSAAIAHADNWPAWRGPTGQGFCTEKNLPLTWSARDARWKVALEHQGNSTPVIWGDRIFLTQANKGGTIRSLLCFARADGKKLWQKDVEYKEKERNWNENWYANASPVTDGQRVIISLGSAGMCCFDFEGNELWNRTDLGSWQHSFGNASSPVIYGDLAILWCGPNEGKKGNVLLAVDKATGKTRWEHNEKVGSWGTPLITRIDGQDQLLLSMAPYLKGIDPKVGKPLWSCEGLTKYVYTSPLYGNGIAVAMSGYGGAAFAVKVGGTGDITKDRLWHHPKNTQRVGSGMVIGDHVYMVDENGTPRCYEGKTGEDVWKVEQRPGSGNTWGSMVHADGRLYVLMRNADTLVFAARPKYEHLATNSLGSGEQTNSSLAISDGDIFIRTFKNLWCIRQK